MPTAPPPRTPPFLATLLGATLCACAHTPAGINTPIKENTTMPMEERSSTTQPKLGAEAVLGKILELIRDSRSVDDFTAEKVAAVTGLQMHHDGPNRFGAHEILTPEWWYLISMDKTTMNGPQFMFDFHPVKPGTFPDATPICSMDFDAFSHALEGMGFIREVRYGEHGRIDAYDFQRPGLWVSVAVQGEANEPVEKISHHCVQMIIIR